MYPCSNPELVAAASESGGIGIIQPIAMVYAHQHDFREGLQLIKSITDKPIGMNVIVEKSVSAYEERMKKWMDIALEEGIRFFVTALGNPQWVVDKAHAYGGIVYHNITTRKWAERALKAGVDGLICVNDNAGGHAGTLNAAQLFEETKDLGVPILCAGGIGDAQDMSTVLDMGYQGVQLGTRFIAAEECVAHSDYKDSIVNAEEKDIVLTDKISGVPCAIIETESVKKMGAKAGPIARMLLKGRKTKHWTRTYYAVLSLWKFKRSSRDGMGYKDYFQAGKSVGRIHGVETVAQIMSSFSNELNVKNVMENEVEGANHD
ncbi:2-nitropropane dioxygenase [Gammaproteobacteria bacterium 45_16_T64]|nr:2-nitropropane dioxygenase [Gammaproteobacteria bacterium 45_16_T64]